MYSCHGSQEKVGITQNFYILFIKCRILKLESGHLCIVFWTKYPVLVDAKPLALVKETSVSMGISSGGNRVIFDMHTGGGLQPMRGFMQTVLWRDPYPSPNLHLYI